MRTIVDTEALYMVSWVQHRFRQVTYTAPKVNTAPTDILVLVFICVFQRMKMGRIAHAQSVMMLDADTR